MIKNHRGAPLPPAFDGCCYFFPEMKICHDKSEISAKVLPQMKICHDKSKISAEDSGTKRIKRRDGIQHIDIQLLPEDIIMDILSRLPIYSLFQCTLVLKAWRDMIVHNPVFATMQHNRALENRNNTLLMFSRGNSPGVNLYLVESEAVGRRKLRVMDAKLSDCFNDRLDILGSCNGLLCISSYRGDRLYISNPITGECKKLPSKERYRHAWAMGIGFDSARKEYKVVRGVCEPEKQFSWKVEIHILGTNSWRQIVNFPSSCWGFSLCNFSDVLVNGSLHWCPSRETPLHITSLDMSEEQFGVVPTPELANHHHIQLMAWKGFLTLIQQLWEERSVHIWVMKEYNVRESWTKQINVRMPMPSLSYSSLNYWPFDDETLIDDMQATDHPRLRAEYENDISCLLNCLGVMAHVGSFVSLKKYRGRGKVDGACTTDHQAKSKIKYLLRSTSLGDFDADGACTPDHQAKSKIKPLDGPPSFCLRHSYHENIKAS
ncbi:hypothetical protein AAC387_Pa04g0712 [Persea americana]